MAKRNEVPGIEKKNGIGTVLYRYQSRGIVGGPGGDRTRDLRLAKPLLIPAELQARI